MYPDEASNFLNTEKRGTYSRVSSTVGVAGVGLVVQACSWKGVCIPGWLAAVPLGAEARAHGHP